VILEIIVGTAKALFASVYRPPKGGYFDEFSQEFISLGIDYKYHIVAGDVNAHFGSLKPCDIRDGKQVHEFLDTFNLERVPFNPTYHVNDCHSQLDMIACSFPDLLVSHAQFPTSGLSNHDLLVAVFSLSVPKYKPRLACFRSFKNFRLEDCRKDVRDTPWHEMFPFHDIDSKVDFFNYHVHALFDKHAPYVEVELRSRPIPWLTADLIVKIKERDRMYKKVRGCSDKRIIAQYRKFRNRVKTEIRSARDRYAYKILSNSASSKVLWKNLKKLDVVSSNIDTSCTPPSSEELNAHYTAVACPNEDLVKNCIRTYETRPVLPVDETFFFKDVSHDDVRKAIHGVSATAKGVDDISGAMLKLCLDEFLPAIIHIFNYSLQSGCFPKTWKIANVKPLPKKAGAQAVKDFRPISLLCTLGKALEKIVHAQIVEFMLRNSLFNSLQSGFRSSHSTSTALLKVVGDIREGIDLQQLSILVLYDFSNAFPSVHHDLLLAKLRIFGFSISVVSWFESYLKNRAQRVVNGSDISSLIFLLFGVPQGSVLGPLLYSIYVNDINTVFNNSKYHLYADDLQNYVSFRLQDLNTAVSTINEEASNLSRYAACHNLAINASKTQAIIIGNHKILKKLPSCIPSVVVNGCMIPYSETVVNLGVVVDKHLSWDAYAITVCKNSFAAIHGIKRSCHVLSAAVRKRLIEALVFPVLDYANTVTAQMLVVYSLKLQRVQNACARVIYNLRRDCHISKYVLHLNWLNVSNRFKYSIITLLKRVLDSRQPSYLLEKLQFATECRSRFVRNSSFHLRIPQHRTEKYRGAFWIQAPLLWNEVPDCILGLKNISNFKVKLKAFLLSTQ